MIESYLISVFGYFALMVLISFLMVIRYRYIYKNLFGTYDGLSYEIRSLNFATCFIPGVRIVMIIFMLSNLFTKRDRLVKLWIRDSFRSKRRF